jgi:toxin-antitoxin system PIN domain toxin
MMFVVDTNILVYAADRSFPEHEACRKRLEEWRAGSAPWYLTWGIVYEFLRVVTHPRVLKRPWRVPEAWRFVEAVLASETLGMLVETPRHAALAAQTMCEVAGLEGNLMHDGHTAVLMREHGLRRIVTRDSHFHRFPFLDVVDPLA